MKFLRKQKLFLKFYVENSYLLSVYLGRNVVVLEEKGNAASLSDGICEDSLSVIDSTRHIRK
jgi:hypothetical protein